MKRRIAAIIVFSLMAVAMFSGCNKKENERKLEDSSVVSAEESVSESDVSALTDNTESSDNNESKIKTDDKSSTSSESKQSSQDESSSQTSADESKSASSSVKVVIPIFFRYSIDVFGVIFSIIETKGTFWDDSMTLLNVMVPRYPSLFLGEYSSFLAFLNVICVSSNILDPVIIFLSIPGTKTHSGFILEPVWRRL